MKMTLPEMPEDLYNPEKETQRRKPMKWIVGSVAAIVGVAHIGVLGHLLVKIDNKIDSRPMYPSINLPTGKYSSYDVNVDRNGYSIKYKANDPKVLESERSVDLDKGNGRKGFFDSKSFEQRREYRRDQYTMDGTRNLGGVLIESEGKSTAKSEECIRADAGARSQGAMAGSAITTGVVAPAVMGIPYVGWLAAGWATLLGNKVGESVGSEVGSAFNDC